MVDRNFVADTLRLLVADIKYIPTWSGRLYLAVVLDVFSRRTVRWSLRSHLRSELVLEALEMAVYRRRPNDCLVHHSDQAPSLGSRGRCNTAWSGRS